MKNIIRREQSTNSATFTNKVLLKYRFRLSVVQIYLWSSVLVSKTTLGGRPWSVRLRFISILKQTIRWHFKASMHSRHHECQQEKATGKRVNTAIIFDNHNQSNEISYYIMNVSRKSDLQTCYRYYIWQSQSKQWNIILHVSANKKWRQRIPKLFNLAQSWLLHIRFSVYPVWSLH
jgi:hypothetical protein